MVPLMREFTHRKGYCIWMIDIIILVKEKKKIKPPDELTKEQKAIFKGIIEEYADVFAVRIADLGLLLART